MKKQETVEEKQKFYFAPFDNCHCKGHSNAMLDDTYEKEESRNSLIRSLENYIVKAE